MKDNSINTGNPGMAPAVTDGINMQVSTHSNGLMFEQSIGNQRNQFHLGLATSSTNIKKMLDSKIKHTNVIDRSNARSFEMSEQLKSLINLKL